MSAGAEAHRMHWLRKLSWIGGGGGAPVVVAAPLASSTLATCKITARTLSPGTKRPRTFC